MQRLTKLSLRRNVEYNVQLLSINVHVINHFIVISTNSNIFVVHLPIVKTIGGGIKIPVTSGIGKFMSSVFGLDLSTYNLLNELDFIIEPTLDYIIKPQLAKLSKFIPDEQIPKVVNSYLDAAISKATAKGSVNLFGFEFEATAFQNLKREIDNSLKNNVSHDERPA